MRKNPIALFLFLTLAAVLVTSGCQRQRAEISLRKTQQTLTEIRENYGGLEHEPDRVAAVQQKVDQAYSLLEAEAGQALELARSASSDVSQLLEIVKPREANSVFSRAREEIRIADINDLRGHEPTRYQRIRDLMGEAETARADNNWDRVIDRSRTIINEVEAGLAEFQHRAEQRGIEAEEMLRRLRQTGGTIYAPEVVISVQDDINTATRIAGEDRDYQLAINRFGEAITKAEDGIDRVMGERSRRELEKVEALLTAALIEGATNFKPDEYERTFNLYEELLERYRDGRYTEVLEGAPFLITRAETLVVDTKRAASDDRIATMEGNIRELEHGGILEYIPGSLDELRRFLADSTTLRQQDDEPAFDEIKRLSIDAREEYERVREQFHQLALDRIRQAKNQLETSRAVFDRMEEIFDPVDGPMTPAERAFEAQKRTRQTQLGTTLEEASVNLNVADLRRQQGQFRGAIELAREVNQVAAEVLGQIYYTVAHNAAIELAQLISRYERDGAREYAPEELARSNASLQEVQRVTAAGDYQRAVELAAEARAEVELMAQRIAGRATENLRDARHALHSATSDKTRHYRGEMLDQVVELIDQAEEHLQAERLKMAVETAQRATALARQAENEANMLSATDRIQEAHERIAQAQDAGAELFAGREMEDSRRLLASARSLFAAEDYVQAESLAVSSAQRANNALYKKVDEAEAAIASARSVGGWEYDSDTLARAYTNVRQARQLIEERQYNESHRLAERAESSATSLTGRAKDHSFRERIRHIKRNLDEGTRQGINFFQPDESIAVRRRLAELENMYSRDDYERVMAQVEQLEMTLRVVLDDTDQLVTTVADQQGRRLDRLVEAGALQFATGEVAQARNDLKYAQMDYRRGLYRAAHSSLNRAINLINEVEYRLHYERYTRDVETLLAEYRDVQVAFSNILSLDPVELKELAVGAGGAARSVAISAQINPMQFRNEVDELYGRALLIEVPRGMERLHETVIQAFAEGRIGAMHFEKLAILNRMAVREAHQLIDQAYRQMNVSNRMVADVQQQLVAEQTGFRVFTPETFAIISRTN